MPILGEQLVIPDKGECVLPQLSSEVNKFIHTHEFHTAFYLLCSKEEQALAKKFS